MRSQIKAVLVGGLLLGASVAHADDTRTPAERKADSLEQEAHRTRQQADAKADRLEDKADRTRDHADKRDDHARAKTKGTAAKVGDEMSEAWITTKVKASFIGEDVLKRSSIDVDTAPGGVVTLTGGVPSAAARARAVELARGIKGVRSVKDELRVIAGPADGDR